MKKTMPTVDLSLTKLSGRDLEIAKGCLNKNALRASKPQKDGESAYVWRHVAFSISPHSQHWCMPCTSDFDLPHDPYWIQGNGDIRRARTKELDKIVDAIVNVVPRQQWYGVNRWARAFGL